MNRDSYLTTSNPKDCTGCDACAFACPTGAIAMSEDACGFEYPNVDTDKCIKCGKCLRTCHMASCDNLKHKDPVVCYGAIDDDVESLRQSASGGVATALSRRVVGGGGIVYGCVADREDVHHERLVDMFGLKRAQGSKYVQSDLSRVFAPMAEDLKAGSEVLFVGTPCQCAAVRSLFGKYENLLTVDLVCEGVPSRKMYGSFLDNLEKERGQRITDFRFRDKCRGWSTKNAIVLGNDGIPLKRQLHSCHYYYYHLFTKALILRESCYECPYACANRVGDVTVGDFWGVETAGLGYELKDFKSGISCVLVNDERGKAMLENLNLDLRSCRLNTLMRANGCLEKPSTCNSDVRNCVLSAFAKDGAKGMEREYGRGFTKKNMLREDVAANIPLRLRVVLKRAKAVLSRKGK